MKRVLTLAGAAVLFAAVANAQAPSPQPAPTPTAPATAPAPDKSGATVSGVTVRPLPRKPCAPKDKDCVAMVMAEVKNLYPEQLKSFCFQQQMDVMRQDMQANMAGWCEGPGLGAAAICSHHVSPVVKQVCAPDKK
ncbi:MAG TPA: hypothetical protein VHN39_14035 [Phenylobacterium sp.]|jgi:hypothetical protein|nr:hypothetical protein [Phenylobacterium sp.]